MAWALQVVTGSFDRPGGAWFNPGFLSRLDRRRLPRGDGTPAASPPSRPDLPSRFGERPCAALADEIEAGNVKALLVIGGSPLTALPDTARLAAAFERLDVLAVADVVETATVAAATHVLPVAGQLERADVTAFVELFLSAVAVQRTPAVVAPAGERRPLWWVLGSLARRLGRDVLDSGLDPATADEAAVMDAFLARLGADPSDTDVAEGAVARVDGTARPYGWVTGHALPDGRWRLAPVPLLDQLARLEAGPGRPALVLVPRRVVRRMNSAVGDRVATAPRPEDTAVLVHPDDAAAVGVGDGDPVRIRSAVGELVTEVRLRPDLVPGTVSVPHGLPGRNVSLLTGARPGSVDPLTGMIVQSGLPVTVERLVREESA
jgi:anaerobic selenocysteine-containing dehydrogenase